MKKRYLSFLLVVFIVSFLALAITKNGDDGAFSGYNEESECGDRICSGEETYRTCPIDCEVWKDDFIATDPRWRWEYRDGTGYHRLETIENVTVVEIGITDQSISTDHSDCSLNEKVASHQFGVFESRLRCTDNNEEVGQGTRGWGFWNPVDGYYYEAAWFLSCSPESDDALHGLQAMVLNQGQIVYQKPLTIDMREWHVYRVEMLPTGTDFYVDDVLVAATDHKVRDDIHMEMLWWIDNKRVYFINDQYQLALLNVKQDQKMYIDWVKYYER